jgi:hypothetical protein
LFTKNIYFKISKLTPKFISPFKITEYIRKAVYKLKLLSIYNRLYNVFNINLLKKYYIQKSKRPKSYNKKSYLSLLKIIKIKNKKSKQL